MSACRMTGRLLRAHHRTRLSQGAREWCSTATEGQQNKTPGGKRQPGNIARSMRNASEIAAPCIGARLTSSHPRFVPLPRPFGLPAQCAPKMNSVLANCGRVAPPASARDNVVRRGGVNARLLKRLRKFCTADDDDEISAKSGGAPPTTHRQVARGEGDITSTLSAVRVYGFLTMRGGLICRD